MCEATVYLRDDDNEQQIMQDVTLLQPEGNAWLLVNLLGEQKLVRGIIEKVDFLRHRVYLKAESPAESAESLARSSAPAAGP